MALPLASCSPARLPGADKLSPAEAGAAPGAAVVFGELRQRGARSHGRRPSRRRHAGGRRCGPGPRLRCGTGGRRRCRVAWPGDGAAGGRSGTGPGASAREDSRWPPNDSPGTLLRRGWKRSTSRSRAAGFPHVERHHAAHPDVQRGAEHRAHAGAVVVGARRRDRRQREHRSNEQALASARHPGVRWFERAFTTHAEQWNFGLQETSISTEWVLALDADFVLSDALIEELKQLRPESGVGGYRGVVHLLHRRPAASRRRLSARHGAVSPRSRKLRPGRAHAARSRGRRGPAAREHDLSRRSQAAWPLADVAIAIHEARSRQAAEARRLRRSRLADRVRQMIVVAPAAMFVYCLIGKGGILDGWPGLVLRDAARYGGTDPVAQLLSGCRSS